MKAGYEVHTAATVSLTASTAKTVLMAIAPSQFGLDLIGYSIGFTSTTATDAPALCELAYCTLATNSTPGTNNTAATVRQIYGRTITPGFTGLYNCTSEPTVLTVFDGFELTPVGGMLNYDYTFGRSPDSDVSTGIALRITPAANTSVYARFVFERA